MTPPKIDPNAIIAEGVEAAARQERTRNLILGALMLAAAVAFAIFGVLIFTGHAFHDTTELALGSVGLALSLLWVGTIKLSRGLTQR